MESGRKGGEVIWLRDTSLVGGKEEEGYHRLGDLPRGKHGSSHILGTPSLGFDTGKMSPLSWFENQWGLITGGL